MCPLAFAFSSSQSKTMGLLLGLCVFSTVRLPAFLSLFLLRKAPHLVRPVVHAQRTIQVFAHHYPHACQRAPPTHPPNLQDAVREAHRVVAVHHPLVLQRKRSEEHTSELQSHV